MHTPVLLQQAIENLNIKPEGRYIDATFGEGGYSQEILKKRGKVLAIDLDIKQLNSWRVNELTSLKLVHGNFKDIERIAEENDFHPVDGVVFDLGLSMKQIEESGRGFSYKKLDEPLDMRLSLENQLTATDLLNKLEEKELYDVFAKNSEDLNSKIIAQKIIDTRGVSRLERVKDLLTVIDKVIGRKDVKTYSRIFQALRIEVNHEFENLKQGLKGAVKIINKGGRIVVVSFHSLEDRIVKNFVRENSLKFLFKKPIRGVRSYERSAKLRTVIL